MVKDLQMIDLMKEEGCEGSKNYFNADGREKVNPVLVRAMPSYCPSSLSAVELKYRQEGRAVAGGSLQGYKKAPAVSRMANSSSEWMYRVYQGYWVLSGLWRARASQPPFSPLSI